MSPSNQSDHDLLRQYARESSETAFAELVRRHLNLVYSAARRQVRSPQLAEEVAQSVFLDLSRGASGFPVALPMVAWLHVVTRRTAIDVIRRESRRQAREHQAACPELVEWAEIADMKPTSTDWSAVEPLLDEAVESLNESDRAAVLLRYFENKSLREIGAALGASEDAAQKRVSRAVEQLRAFFLRRGVTVTGAGLATDLSAHALQIAPVTLGPTIASATALSSVTSGQAALETARTLAMTTLQKNLFLAALVAVAGGGLYEATVIDRQHRESQALARRTATLSTELRQLQREQLVAARQLPAVPTAATTGEAALEPEMQAWLARVNRLKQLSSRRPDLCIPEMQLLTEQDWFETARNPDSDLESNVRPTLQMLRSRAKSQLQPRLGEALRRYLAAHDGWLPDDPVQLAPFFGGPIDPMILQRYEMLQTGKPNDAARGDWVLDEKSSVDEEYDMRLWLSLAAGGSTDFRGLKPGEVRAALAAFAATNHGQLPATPAQLVPFFKNPLSPHALKNFLQTPNEHFTPAELQKILAPSTRNP